MGDLQALGADIDGLPRTAGSIPLRRQDWELPAAYPYPGGEIVPFRAGAVVRWWLEGQGGKP